MIKKKRIPDTQDLIAQVCQEIKSFLIDKNKSYGDSAINPIRIFAKSDAIEQINIRIDDKINRFLQGHKYPGDDDELDLIGYLILKRVAKLKNKA
jgi:hypothetical protein